MDDLAWNFNFQRGNLLYSQQKFKVIFNVTMIFIDRFWMKTIVYNTEKIMKKLADKKFLAFVL